MFDISRFLLVGPPEASGASTEEFPERTPSPREYPPFAVAHSGLAGRQVHRLDSLRYLS